MYKDILLPIDLAHDGSARKTIKVATEYAQAFGTTIHLMTIIPDSGMSLVNQYFTKGDVSQIIEETGKSLRSYGKDNFPEDLNVKFIVTTGSIYEAIINTAKKIDVDLIIMSAHRPELKDYLLGPNSSRVVRHSDKSVLVVRK